MMYIVNVTVSFGFTVEAESEEEAITKATTLKRYSLSSPDGERIDIDKDCIQSVEENEGGR